MEAKGDDQVEKQPTFNSAQQSHLKIRLKQILEARELTRNYLARKARVSYATVNRWYQGNLQHLNLDLLARFCTILNCRVEDLVEYVKEE